MDCILVKQNQCDHNAQGIEMTVAHMTYRVLVHPLGPTKDHIILLAWVFQHYQVK